MGLGGVESGDCALIRTRPGRPECPGCARIQYIQGVSQDAPAERGVLTTCPECTLIRRALN